jgi:hypothetical protein
MNSKILPKVTMIKKYFQKRKEKSSLSGLKVESTA